MAVVEAVPEAVAPAVRLPEDVAVEVAVCEAVLSALPVDVGVTSDDRVAVCVAEAVVLALMEGCDVLVGVTCTDLEGVRV